MNRIRARHRTLLVAGIADNTTFSCKIESSSKQTLTLNGITFMDFKKFRPALRGGRAPWATSSVRLIWNSFNLIAANISLARHVRLQIFSSLLTSSSSSSSSSVRTWTERSPVVQTKWRLIARNVTTRATMTAAARRLRQTVAASSGLQTAT